MSQKGRELYTDMGMLSEVFLYFVKNAKNVSDLKQQEDTENWKMRTFVILFSINQYYSYRTKYVVDKTCDIHGRCKKW